MQDSSHKVQAATDAPLGPVEMRLAGLWREILGVESVGRHADFFDLGGTSLSLLILWSAIDEDMNAAIDLELLFMSPTIAGHAEAIESAIQEDRPGPV